jgi:hypothetical protein
MDYEGPLRIPKNEKLSADEAEVEARFAAQIQGRLDEVIAEYLVRFGTVIDTDRARELCGDYSATKATRTRFSRAVYNPAKALADEIYRREIRKTAPPRGWRVLFTSGGTGAGKSTALAWWKKRPGLTTDMTFSWTAGCRTTRQRGQRYGGRSRWATALRLFTSIANLRKRCGRW